MDEEIITQIINDFPQLTTQQLMSEYNQHPDVPFKIKSYNQFISLITEYPNIHDKIMMSKENRRKKLQLAMQDAEDALLLNASLGDIRSIEFLLKTQKEEYREKKQLDISISHSYQEQLQQLDIAITSNKLPQLEAEIVDDND